MATSATPPPDHASGDETALCDVSEMLPMIPTNEMNALKRTLSMNNLLSTTSDSNPNSSPVIDHSPPRDSIESDESPMDSVENHLNTEYAKTNNDQMSSLLLDPMPDNSKKRRKQSMPFRISDKINAALNKANALQIAKQNAVKIEVDSEQFGEEQSTPRIFLSKLCRLQELPPTIETKDINEHSNVPNKNGRNENLHISPEQLLKSLAQKFSCEQCGLRLTSEIQLGLHMLQEHSPAKMVKEFSKSLGTLDGFPKHFLSKELTATLQQTWNNDDSKSMRAVNQMKPDDWLASLSNLPFGFSPETAIMLSASGYLPQMPLLGVANPYQGSDGIPRTSAPPLRIFNPEAYCELCNKEFCNKYFLKTHKANKHNIYESSTGSGSSSVAAANTGTAANPIDNVSNNELSQLSHLFQLQQQQLMAAQSISPKSPPQSNSQCQSPSNGSQSDRSSGGENSILCDVCFKRFPNMVAMRRHRTKVHEIITATEIVANGDNKAVANDYSITIPDDFREDYQIEQEDATFTPQPRKLSPQSIQQAREANFAEDKLKGLGVINPEAFCEICCKEYCNKYFLRTHKMKRHGLLIPMDDIMSKDDDSMVNAAAAAASAWQLMQNSPLNLIMNHHGTLNQFQNQRIDASVPQLRKFSTDSNDDEREQLARKKPKITSNSKNHMQNDAIDNDEQHEKIAALDGEHISVDLQKLQSMIMQLNDLNAHRPVACSICGKELDNQFALHSHMLLEHGSWIGDNNNGHKSSSPSSPIRSQQTGSEQCKHCDKELPNQFALTQHVFEVHGITLSSPIREGFVTPERPVSGPINLPPQQIASAQQNDRRPYIITPTSSYCEICNKELCNKYFMKTHMQRMHGIEIENGAQIGGVVCNICNKELCSKYFLRVHKHNSHGIVDDGTAPPNVQRSSTDSNEANEPMYRIDTSTPIKSNDIHIDLINRYVSQIGDVCPLCSRRFRGARWLRSHLLSDHGKSGADKLREIEQSTGMLKNAPKSPTIKIPNGNFAGNNELNVKKQPIASLIGIDGESGTASSSTKPNEYQCSYCSFSTPSYAFLYIHKRSLHATQLNAETMNSNDGDPNDGNLQNLLALDGQASNATTPQSTPATTPISTRMTDHDSKDNEIESLAKLAGAKHESQTKINIDGQLHSQGVLLEMANLTRRPTTYAIPQEADTNTVMQSFLMQPIIDGDDTLAESDAISLRSRFVPSVVFLPVKERIVGKTTISFSLTPA